MKTNKYLSKNAGIALTRHVLGLTQEQLAAHLQISRSLLSMVEKGRRSFSGKTLTKIAEMEIKLFEAGVLDEEKLLHTTAFETVAHRNMKTQVRHTRANQCREQAGRLSRRLENMKLKYAQTVKWLHAIETILKNEAAVISTRQISSWKKQQAVALKKLETCNLPLQTALQQKITLLETEVALYESRQQKIIPALTNLFFSPLKQ